MSTTLSCPSCETRLKYAGAPGKLVKCPRCAKSFRAPEEEPEEDFEVVEDEDDEPAPKRRASAPAAKRKPKPAHDEDTETDQEAFSEEPRSKKKRRAEPRTESLPPLRSRRSRDEDEDEDDRPRRRSRNDEDDNEEEDERPRRRSRDEDDDDEEEERPRRKGKKIKPAGSPALLWVGVGGGALVLVAAIVLLVLLMWPKPSEPLAAKPANVPNAPAPIQQLPGHASPQAAFDAFVNALERRDGKGLVDSTVSQTRRDMAGLFGYIFIAVPAGGQVFVPEQEKAAITQALTQLLEKHGLTKEVTKNVAGQGIQQMNPNALKQGMAQVTGLIKDHDAFLIDSMDFLRQHGKNNAGFQAGKPTLSDVKIDGDKATGKSVTQAPFPKEEIIDFVKDQRGWRVSLRDVVKL